MTNPLPTDGELAILRALWTIGAPATVRQVHDELLRGKDTAYTTVLKMLTIMTDKELVQRDDSERSHRYTALYSEPAVQSSLLKSFMANAFAGSAFKVRLDGGRWASTRPQNSLTSLSTNEIVLSN